MKGERNKGIVVTFTLRESYITKVVEDSLKKLLDYKFECLAAAVINDKVDCLLDRKVAAFEASLNKKGSGIRKEIRKIVFETTKSETGKLIEALEKEEKDSPAEVTS